MVIAKAAPPILWQRSSHFDHENEIVAPADKHPEMGVATYIYMPMMPNAREKNSATLDHSFSRTAWKPRP